jgi:hypothetical protein
MTIEEGSSSSNNNTSSDDEEEETYVPPQHWGKAVAGGSGYASGSRAAKI